MEIAAKLGGFGRSVSRGIGGRQPIERAAPFFFDRFSPTLCGKRSAITAEAALRAGRLVVYLDGVAFVPVGGIQTIDADDWQAGWLLHPASISPHGANGELT